jgi:hypothetical protein
MGMMKHHVVALTVLLLFAGCSGGDGTDPGATDAPTVPVPAPLDALSWTGQDCAELALFVSAPASRVRPFVDPAFTVIEAQDTVQLAVGLARCASATVLGNTTNNLVMSDVGVYVENPAGGPDPVLYQFWQASNRKMTIENMSRVGLPTQFAPSSNFLTFGLVQATLIESRLASVEGEYRAQATSVPASGQAPPQNFRWYHASENGTMYTDFGLTFHSAGPANGNITIDPESDLAKMTGETTVEGTGAFWTFEMVVNARRVPG